MQSSHWPLRVQLFGRPKCVSCNSACIDSAGELAESVVAPDKSIAKTRTKMPAALVADRAVAEFASLLYHLE